ncbi:hypothetical protein NDU88_007827 [Pleurodeles waltl]|uniref:Uncharacterized protein n=1 Tax=Pleurodeles waltl TaxID=8319 RepID=A0AAV7NXM7_PLEWA|nr:hypothetical protein NDU88_007827 [Pleurodeles waltl]
MATRGPATTQLNTGNHAENQELDLEEIIKAAREAAVTHSKDWILKQIRGDEASDEPVQEGQTSDRPSSAARDEEEPLSEARARPRNGSGTQAEGPNKGTRRMQASYQKQGPKDQASEQK